MKYPLTTLVTGLIMANAVSAATVIDLHRQPATYLQRYLTVQQKLTANTNQTRLEQTRTDIDFNQTAHTRLQQTYAGYSVWNATAVVHTPKVNSKDSSNMLASVNSNTTMNGTIYEGLEKDLANTPSFALSDAQKTKAVQQAKFAYERKTGLTGIQYQQESTKTIIYLDENKQARYAYLISFYVDDNKTGAHRPTVIMDAASLRVYRSWDQVMTTKRNSDGPEVVIAGGIGGNEKIGQIIYDGDTGHNPGFKMQSFKTDIEVLPGQKITFSFCVFENDDIIVKDVAYDSVTGGLCYSQTNKHNQVAWLDWDNNETRWKDDEMNSGYSPSLDAFYGATVVKNLYQDWYGIPVLTQEDGKTPMKLLMRVHYGRNYENAFWDGKQMTFGDGGRMFYPFASLGVAAHEISHGFTQQHSNIDSSQPQMAALHEAFSDMAAVSAEYYLKGTNHWDIGREIMKGEGALRYLDDPKKDGRSIDNMKDFDETEAHSGAGVFNKAFYLIATSKGWDTRKAFNIMAKANMHYWTSSMKTFTDAACGVLSATKDYNYDIADVRVAFAKVGIDTGEC